MLLCVLSTRLLIYIKRYGIFGSFSLSFFSTLVFKLVTLIYIPPTVFNDSSFPTSSSEFVIVYLMISSSLGWGEIWVDISFALSWRLRMVDIFHIFLGHLYFFWKLYGHLLINPISPTLKCSLRCFLFQYQVSSLLYTTT